MEAQRTGTIRFLRIVDEIPTIGGPREHGPSMLDHLIVFDGEIYKPWSASRDGITGTVISARRLTDSAPATFCIPPGVKS